MIEPELSLPRSDLFRSAAIHLLLGAVVAYLIFGSGHSRNLTEKIKVEFREIKPQVTVPEIKVSDTPKPKEILKAKRVFGISKDTLTSANPDAVQVKSGNTIAKQIDNEKMDPKDAVSLPVPVEEYLISQMPKLKNEVKIAYPAEAKAKNIEGPVVMDVLIDSEGKVRSALLINGPGSGLDEAALKAIYSFQFSPALVDGKPVAVRIRYSYRFVLN